jgi:hypothetical protein
MFVPKKNGKMERLLLHFLIIGNRHNIQSASRSCTKCMRLNSITSGINREVSNDFLLIETVGQGCTVGARGTSDKAMELVRPLRLRHLHRTMVLQKFLNWLQ